jgi:hypothetical protein
MEVSVLSMRNATLSSFVLDIGMTLMKQVSLMAIGGYGFDGVYSPSMTS